MLCCNINVHCFYMESTFALFVFIVFKLLLLTLTCASAASTLHETGVH